jgi:hypothetical protein
LPTLLNPDAIAACVEEGARERAPNFGRFHYVGFVDAASGSGRDSFTACVAHADGERIVVDATRAHRPPINPSGAIAEVATLLRGYGLHTVTGDRYAPGFVQEHFRANGITYQPSPLDRSGLYLELVPHVNSGRVVLLDDAETLRELRGLERRRGTSGRDKVDHRVGSHNDRANSLAGAVALVASMGRRTIEVREVRWG